MPGSIIIQMILHNPSLIQTLLSVLESHQISRRAAPGRGLYRRLGIQKNPECSALLSSPDPEEFLFLVLSHYTLPFLIIQDFSWNILTGKYCVLSTLVL